MLSHRAPRCSRSSALPLFLAALLALAIARPAPAQSLAQRVANVADGTVRLSFAARAGVCGDGRNNISTRRGEEDDDADVDGRRCCEPGPVRISLIFTGRRVTRVRAHVGGQWRPATTAGTTDLGTVPAREAAEWLLAIARRDDPGAEHAILPATLADSVVVWPDLLAIARDHALRSETRRQAVFWVGQAAGEAATHGLDALVADDSVDRSVREQAVFALSQRPRDEAVPALIRIARSHRDPAIRKKALFWLGQSEDERALGLFEELLAK